MTHLCVPIFVHSLEQAWLDAVLAGEAGADLVEYRVDYFAKPEQIRFTVSRPGASGSCAPRFGACAYSPLAVSTIPATPSTAICLITALTLFLPGKTVQNSAACPLRDPSTHAFGALAAVSWC